jgi:hypothetical protein
MSLWQLPAILFAFIAWMQSEPVSLADAANREALRRQLTPKSVRSLTNDDVNGLPRRPLPTAPVTEDSDPAAKPAAAAAGAASAAAGAAAAAAGGEVRDEAWWRSHLSDARAALDRDQVLAEALQSSINAITSEWSARDDPAQRQQLFDRRTRAVNELDRMKEQIEMDKKVISALEEAARRENVPAGWLR